MMKFSVIFFVMLLASMGTFAQTISMDAARTAGAGTVVTVRGIVTNGSELGVIRYVQDATGGLAAYGGNLSTINRGDSVELTGTLKDYNQLLEIDPVSSFTVINSGNMLPSPEVIVIDSMNESRESELIRINGVTFTTNPGGTFSSNTSYDFTDGVSSSSIYVRSGHPLIGTVVPAGICDIVGLVSQYSFSSPTTGYQLLCRDTNDIILSNIITFTSPVSESNITQTSIDFSWTTNFAGSSEIEYGNTRALGMTATGTANTTNHSVSLTGLSASELIFVRAISADATDTAKSLIYTFITQSASSGNIISYFNHPVDTTVSDGPIAQYLPQTIDDTLIAYINRAQATIDFTMYNFNESGLSSISTALNNAHNRGVTVRVIFDGSANNSGVQNLDAGINKIGSFQGSQYGIMHNKFIIFDAYNSNANVPLVWTGGTNLTDGQINLDPNTVIIIQDKSLAIAYTLEFNEMFGSETAVPSLTEAKFGPDKSNNTPHNFIIGGKDVQCFFSPSDGTNDQIINTIAAGNNNINIMTMLITRTDIAYALQDAVNINGAALKVLVNHENDCNATVWGILQALIDNDLQDDRALPGIMHHKLMIVDEGTNSSPTLLVGSHNWSNAGNDKNDENTLIFHDNQVLANTYLQAFSYRFNEAQHVGFADVDFAQAVSCYPNPSQGQLTLDITTEKAMDLNIQIYDLTGRVVLSENAQAHIGNNQIRINASQLASGTYVLQAKSQGKQYVSTLIIQ